MKQIRIHQLFKVIKLVNRWPVQTDAQTEIRQECCNIIYLL